jgi:hypothetical protein
MKPGIKYPTKIPTELTKIKIDLGTNKQNILQTNNTTAPKTRGLNLVTKPVISVPIPE